MPRQKFCSVPGCLSTTDVIKREQEVFLAAFCKRCSVQRPCRCPAPDIYTTRRETRTKFASWCSAIGLRSPGYYINVCYKHFSSGCPSRTSPNPDVVKPIWEKHVRDKMNQEGGAPLPTKAKNLSTPPDSMGAVKKRKPILTVKNRVVVTTKTMTHARLWRASPSTTTTKLTVIQPATACASNSSLLRHALMLPKTPLPKASIANHRGATFKGSSSSSNSNTYWHHNYASPPPQAQDEFNDVIRNRNSTLPTTITLPQTPVPLNQLTSMAPPSSSSSCTASSSMSTGLPSSPLTPPNSSSNSSIIKEEDEEILDELIDLDDIMLLDGVAGSRIEDEIVIKEEPLALPLLDQSEDPYLNDGQSVLHSSSTLFASEDLDNTVHKWLEICEANPLPLA